MPPYLHVARTTTYGEESEQSTHDRKKHDREGHDISRANGYEVELIASDASNATKRSCLSPTGSANLSQKRVPRKSTQFV
jgi:hypothetical protein